MAEDAVTSRLTVFIGRKTELSLLLDAVNTTRLVTLTGAGGVGKTRLALEASDDLQQRFADGMCFVDLAAVTSPEALADAVMRIAESPAGHTASGTVTERLIESLRTRRVLLVLDNCEQLTGATGELVMALTKECPEVHVLVTSRESLNIHGETTIDIPPLSVPAQQAEHDEIASSHSVLLFCDRARIRRADFELTEANSATVAELCRRLDGLPLAIELAAARMGAMSPADVLERMGSPLRLLEDTAQGRSDRHTSLRTTIDWSYGLLNEQEQGTLRRCAVFAGGFDLAAAEGVVGDPGADPYDVLDVLSRLVDKSLLAVTEVAGRIRYRMLVTIREYALELLVATPDAAVVRVRHGEFFREFALDAGRGLTGPDEIEWVDRVEAELDNLGSALQWALDTYRITLATDIVLALAIMQLAFDETIGAWSEAVLAYPHPEQDPRRTGVTAFACYVRYFYRGRSESAQTLRQLVEAVETVPADAISLNLLNLGCGLALLNDWPFREMSDRYLEAARAAGDPFHQVHAMASHAWALILAGDDATGAGWDVVAAAERLGNPSALAIAFQANAMAHSVGDPVQAVSLLDRSISAAASVRSHFTQDVSQSMKSTLLVNALTPRAAADALLTSLESPLGRSLPGLSAVGFVEIAALLALGGRPEAAAVVLGGVTGSSRPSPVLWPFAPKEFRDALHSLPGQLRASEWSVLTERGAALSKEQLLMFARAEARELPAGT
jgi:predicted ATPase